ncbi:MAG: hypothetical protein JNM93_02625 [Bacteriovoracaceae bacterium]|nr:hypothetical protein [Bacteriovoracaceae bacterium]
MKKKIILLLVVVASYLTVTYTVKYFYPTKFEHNLKATSILSDLCLGTQSSCDVKIDGAKTLVSCMDLLKFEIEVLNELDRTQYKETEIKIAGKYLVYEKDNEAFIKINHKLVRISKYQSLATVSHFFYECDFLAN